MNNKIQELSNEELLEQISYLGKRIDDFERKTDEAREQYIITQNEVLKRISWKNEFINTINVIQADENGDKYLKITEELLKILE